MGLRILIVDDAPLVRTGLRLLVEQNKDWTVCGEAQDGVDAVEKAAELEPDLVLLDISMPRMNGLTAAPLILKRVPQAKIIVLTLDPSAELVRAATAVGASAFVPKAMATSQLASTIEAIEAGRPAA